VRTLDIPVNARSGAVAQDVLRSFLKAQLRDEASPVRLSGFAQYDIAYADEVDPRDFENVAVQEVVSDEAVLRTFLITTHLYTREEADDANGCSLCWIDFLSEHPTNHAHEVGSREALAAEAKGNPS